MGGKQVAGLFFPDLVSPREIAGFRRAVSAFGRDARLFAVWRRPGRLTTAANSAGIGAPLRNRTLRVDTKNPVDTLSADGLIRPVGPEFRPNRESWPASDDPSCLVRSSRPSTCSHGRIRRCWRWTKVDKQARFGRARSGPPMDRGSQSRLSRLRMVWLASFIGNGLSHGLGRRWPRDVLGLSSGEPRHNARRGWRTSLQVGDSSDFWVAPFRRPNRYP